MKETEALTAVLDAALPLIGSTANVDEQLKHITRRWQEAGVGKDARPCVWSAKQAILTRLCRRKMLEMRLAGERPDDTLKQLIAENLAPLAHMLN